jgi:hypothetical protein
MKSPRGFRTYLEWDRGFRGWLVVFLITTLGAITANLLALPHLLVGLWLLLGYPSARTTLLTLLFFAILASRVGLLAGDVYGLRLFLREDRRNPAFWSRFFAASAVLVPLEIVLGHLAALQMYSGALPSRRGLSTPTAVVLGFAINLAWWAYWSRSRRVQLTYGYTGWHGPRSSPTEDSPTALTAA